MGQARYEAKEERIKKYLKKVLQLVKKFEVTNFVQIPREENMEANALAKEALTDQPMNEFDEVQYIPSIDIPEVLQVQNEGNWMTPIISYLKDGSLPKGRTRPGDLKFGQPDISF